MNGQTKPYNPRTDPKPQPPKPVQIEQLEDEIVCVITSIGSEVFVEQVEGVILGHLSLPESEMQLNLAKLGIQPDQSVKVEKIQSSNSEERWDARVTFYYWSK